MNTQKILQIEQALRDCDALCIANSEPILSALVYADEGKVSPVFYESVAKYNLRHDGENDDQVRERLQAEAFAYHQGQRQ